MKPLIGIIMRSSISPKGHKIKYLYDDIEYAIIKSGGIPLGIPNDNIMPYLDICQGFILEGGDTVDDENLQIIKLLHERNIPLLGICLGMQEMAIAFNAKEKSVSNHLNNDYHEVTIDKESLLYKIIGTTKILVNSRHKSAVDNPNLNISALSNDHVIEAIEDSKQKFFIGLEWHPENMYTYDLNSRKIFDYFIKMCND